MQNGHKVRRPSWVDSAYLKIKGGRIINNCGEDVNFCFANSLLSDDWEVVNVSAERKTHKKVFELFEGIEKIAREARESLKWD